MPAATEEKLYKIGEVCKLADLQPYVLRYWETEFPQLSPNKSGGGQRLYTRREVDTILRIKELLYRDGFTIAGAKKKLDTDVTPVPEEDQPKSEPVAVSTISPQRRKTLENIRGQLRSILAMLDD